jgi:hypothetical protein
MLTSHTPGGGADLQRLLMFFANFDLDVLTITMEWESPSTGDR